MFQLEDEAGVGAKLASQHSKAHMPPVPPEILAFDPTTLERDLALMRNGLDVSFAKECQTPVRRRVQDDIVEWPDEAKRREAKRILTEIDALELSPFVAWALLSRSVLLLRRVDRTLGLGE